MVHGRAKFFSALLLVLTSPLIAQAQSINSYYGQDLAQTPARDRLKSLIHSALDSAHIKTQNGPDQLTESCSSSGNDCYRHQALGYTPARKVLLGRLFLGRQAGKYTIPDLYCDKVFNEDDFSKGKGPGPGKIPSVDLINTEHVWPQSRFSGKFPKEMQKSDLLILLPVGSRANSLRSNKPYGDVVTVESQVCPPSALGWTSRGQKTTRFLTPPSVRGDVARATFYFSVRYNMPIDPEQEETLRQWHHHDPVDADERQRHEEIFKVQFVRNPFVDNPEWVDQIDDF